VRFDAVIFDMDGVLVDSEPLAMEAMRRVMARHGVRYTEADNEEFLGRTTPETCRVLRARHGIAAGEAELARHYLDLRIALTRAAPPAMPGVPAVLERLRAAGYRLALASSAEPEAVAATVEALGIAHLLEAVVSGDQVPRGKPAPDIFLAAARRLGVAPGRCLVVEDTRNGLLAAKAAGMACAVVPCSFTRGQDFREADVRVGALPDLLALPLLAGARG
jgi:HAD superfamily hydrolase (TIGR01509 family)